MLNRITNRKLLKKEILTRETVRKIIEKETKKIKETDRIDIRVLSTKYWKTYIYIKPMTRILSNNKRTTLNRVARRREEHRTKDANIYIFLEKMCIS